MVKNLVFDKNQLSKETKEIIKNYLDTSLSYGNYRYEYYSLNFNNIYTFENMDNNLSYFENLDEYTLITSLQDFYKAINKNQIYELW